jgi:glycolate oxidase FAD binding subunit
VAQRGSLRIAGAGSWLDANRPVRAATVLSTSALAGVVEYVPGDLTLTARAGTSLADIERVTAVHGQWLTLDPFGSESATLGATVATASYGPLAHHFGTPRDVVLGVEFVSGTGALVRGGGRVVKNVAGFDLTRLVTGAWGSLGVLTEITVRLRALPEQTVTLAVDVTNTAERVREIWSRLRKLPFVPFAAELLDGPLAKRVGVDGGAGAATTHTLLIRIGGNAAAVRAQREQLHELGTIRESDERGWERLRAVEPTGAVAVRWSALPSRFAETWAASTRVAERWPGTLRHGDPGRGVVRCILPLDALAFDDATTQALRMSLDSPFTGTRIYERLPAHLWPLCAPNRVSDRLSRDVKRAFDPHRVLNPGVLGELD